VNRRSAVRFLPESPQPNGTLFPQRRSVAKHYAKRPFRLLPAQPIRLGNLAECESVPYKRFD
jgi:hypothetical protein